MFCNYFHSLRLLFDMKILIIFFILVYHYAFSHWCCESLVNFSYRFSRQSKVCFHELCQCVLFYQTVHQHSWDCENILFLKQNEDSILKMRFLVCVCHYFKVTSNESAMPVRNLKNFLLNRLQMTKYGDIFVKPLTDILQSCMILYKEIKFCWAFCFVSYL